MKHRLALLALLLASTAATPMDLRSAIRQECVERGQGGALVQQYCSCLAERLMSSITTSEMEQAARTDSTAHLQGRLALANEFCVSRVLDP